MLRYLILFVGVYYLATYQDQIFFYLKNGFAPKRNYTYDDLEKMMKKPTTQDQVNQNPTKPQVNWPTQPDEPTVPGNQVPGNEPAKPLIAPNDPYDQNVVDVTDQADPNDYAFNPIQPTDCKITYVKFQIPIPVIEKIVPSSVRLGDSVVVRGCHLNGFEGDKGLWIEDNKGNRGFIHAPNDSNTTSFTVTIGPTICRYDVGESGLPCSSWWELTPGNYLVSTPTYWESNKLPFSITQ